MFFIYVPIPLIVHDGYTINNDDCVTDDSGCANDVDCDDDGTNDHDCTNYDDIRIML